MTLYELGSTGRRDLPLIEESHYRANKLRSKLSKKKKKHDPSHVPRKE